MTTAKTFVGKYRTALLSTVLFVFALTVRLVALSQQSLWLDEHLTLRIGHAPTEELPALLREIESNKPPFYFLFINFWFNFGSGDWWLRLPSAIFGAGSCIVAVAIGRQLFSERGGWTLGLLLTLSPFHIWYSQEARPYTLWGLLVALAVLFQLRFHRTPQWQFLIGYILTAVLCCYTFTYAFLLIGFSAVLALLWTPALGKRVLLQLAAANAVVALLDIPALLRVAEATSSGAGFQPTHRGSPHEAAVYSFFALGLGTTFGPPLETLRLAGRGLFRDYPFDAALLVAGGVLLAIAVAAGTLGLWRRNRNAFSFVTAGLLVFWSAPAVINLVNPNVPYNPRYAFPAGIPFLTAVTALFLSALERKGWRLVLSGVFLIFVSVSVVNYFGNPRYGRDDIRSAARFVQSLDPPPASLLICAGFLKDVFEHYYQGPVSITPITVAPASDGQMPADIAASIAHTNRVVLVYSRPDHGDPARLLPAALQTRHRVFSQSHWTGVDVYVFDANVTAASTSKASAYVHRGSNDLRDEAAD